MKTILTLIMSFGIQCLTIAQTTGSVASCSIIYSDKIEAYFYEDSSYVKCNEILIQNLPPLSQSQTNMKLNFATKGNYKFKKAPGLTVPDGYAIHIEDQLTGQSFDLRSQETYSFSFNRMIPDRFILYIKSVPPSKTASR